MADNQKSEVGDAEHKIDFSDAQHEIRNHFTDVAVADFPKSPLGIIVVRSDHTIADAVGVLSEHNILCAPLLDVTKPDDAFWDEKYLGIGMSLSM